MQRASLPIGMSSPRPQRRKNSDDDYFVEETLLFTYVGSKEVTSPNGSPTTQFPKSPIAGSESSIDLQSLIQSVEDLKNSLLIEVHHLTHTSKVKQESSDEEDQQSTGDLSSDDDDHEEILERDSKILKMIKSHEYPDAEIDKLLKSL